MESLVVFKAGSITGYEEIYRSSSSIVYRGELKNDDGTRRPVVLKQLNKSFPTPTQLARFKQEFSLTRSIHGPGVIEAYELIRHENTAVMVLEDFGGRSLWHAFNGKSLPLADFLPLALKIVDALLVVHQHDVIHKDINPSNIVWNEDTDQVKLIDFGISTELAQEHSLQKSPSQLEGTIRYLSPEQTGRMNRTIDYRSDFYSLGMTFYELLTGRLPISSRDPLEWVHWHIAKTAEPLNEANGHIFPVVSDIILKLMAKQAEDRYVSLAGLRYDLHECLQKLLSKSRIDWFRIATQDVSAILTIPQKLYGREAELETLLLAFEEMVQGRKSLVSVAGPSGIGKTSLIRELLKPLVARRGFFVEGKFDQLDQNSPYASLVKAFRGLIRLLLCESDEQIRIWREHLLKAIGGNARLIVEVIPELELIIGQPPEVQDLSAEETRNRFINTFQSFVKAFCNTDQPLAIFLDDLQWADLSSLKLIERLMVDPSTRHLQILVAFRDNEIDATHPLLNLFESLREQDIFHTRIGLGPLRLVDIEQILVDTLHCDLSDIRSLAEICNKKTAGNPYFLGQFLISLNRQSLLKFSNLTNRWEWNTTQLLQAGITDNVIDLMVRNFSGLTDSGRNLIGLASCIGNEFDLQSLADISGYSPEKTAHLLFETIRAGLIIPLNNAYKWAEHLHWRELQEDPGSDEESSSLPRYRFSHDRVQQAAYSLLDDDRKEQIHYRLGGQMTSLFEVANHYWLSRNLHTSEASRVRYAQVQLQAGLRARGSAAFGPALKYFDRGLSGLPANGWQTEPRLTLQLHTQFAEMAYMSGDYPAMESTIKVILASTENLLDQLPVFEIRILALIAQNNAAGALKEGLGTLKKLNIQLPEEPQMADVEQRLGETMTLLGPLSSEQLVELPVMSDPLQLCALRILNRILSASYQCSPLHFPIIVFTMLRLSYQYGNTQSSPFAYASYGLVQCGIVGDYETGYQFGQLALRLIDRLAAEECRAKTGYGVCAFVQHWREPLENTLKPLQDLYHIGRATGDFEYAAWAGMMVNVHGFFAGQPLPDIENASREYRQAISRLGQETAYHHFSIFLQTIANLQDTTARPGLLQGGYYQQEESIPKLTAANDVTGLFIVHFNRMILFYLLQDYKDAEGEATAAQQCLHGVISSAYVPVFHFYFALIHLAQGKQTEGVKEALEKLQVWMIHSPINNEHKVDLLLAEQARVEGNRSLDTLQRYQSAIANARNRGFLQDEALANELLARFLEERNQSDLIGLYITRAYHLYQLWGAGAKIDQLKLRYPNIILAKDTATEPDSRMATLSMSGDDSPHLLDLLSVIKASQAISGEIQLESVLKKLMMAVVETAGAQIGYLLLSRNGGSDLHREWTIEARVGFDEDVSVMLAQPINFAADATLPINILQFVVRSEEPIILSDATQSSQFSNDHYLQHHQPVSVMCAPIIGRGKIIGIIYLENNISRNAFSEKHLETIKLLASQTAISIENASLYATLEERVRERTSELDVANSQLTKLATTDSMTNALNRRHFLELANQEILRAKRYGRALMVMMLDIDLFKKVNDTYGHAAGDEVIVAVASACREILREQDIFGRFGGEEFAILAPETLQEEGFRLAERIRSHIESLVFPSFPDGFNITLSIGLSRPMQPTTTIDQLLHQADTALYKAKEKGRNRVDLG